MCVSLCQLVVEGDITCDALYRSMTPLDKAFMLSTEARLDQETMQAVLASGHSRIPVYQEGHRTNIIGMIVVKELLQYKTQEEVPVSHVRMRSLPRYVL